MSTSGASGPTARSRRDRRDALVDGRRDEHRNGHRSARTIGELDVVANRLPVAWTDGVGWERAPGGLVTALEAVVRRHRLRWFGAAAAADGDHRPAWSHGPLVGVRVDPWITDAAVTGMSNSTLWPALHGIGERIRWRDSWWDGYVDYNRAFADEIVATAARGASIWVHDYQLLLVPAMLAAQRPDLVVGLSIHTPVDEALGRLPAGDAITDALSAAAVIGVQTDRDRRTLLDLLPERGVSTASSRVPALPEVLTSPVSIDPDAALALLRDPATDAIAQRVRDRLEGRYLIVGIDRVDYTKAVEERLRGIDLAFRRGHLDPDRVDIVQDEIGIGVLRAVEPHHDTAAPIIDGAKGVLVGDVVAQKHRIGRIAAEVRVLKDPLQGLALVPVEIGHELEDLLAGLDRVFGKALQQAPDRLLDGRLGVRRRPAKMDGETEALGLELDAVDGA